MKSSRLFDRRAGYSLASLGLLLGMIVPSVLPAFASAAQLSSRSVALSSSAAGATNVSYEVKFTAATAAGGIVLEFCNDSPIPGQTCTPPVGFTAASAATATAGYAISGTPTANVVKLTKTIAASDVVDFTLTGLTNPTAATTSSTGLYTRILTYNGTFTGYTDSTTIGTPLDQGGVALAITSAIGVSAAVRESMTFCVSGQAPTKDCSGTNSPSMTLGEAVGSEKALSATAVSTGNVFAQLSTNAVNGAIVSLKSDATSCGGLYLNGDTSKCYLAPQTTPTSSTINAGDAKFGLTVGSVTDPSDATSTSGSLLPSGNYDSSHYFIDYAAGNGSGVTSTYGSPVFNSNSQPVNNKNIQMTFGASVSNTTPAGKYGATLNLIATGTF